MHIEQISREWSRQKVRRCPKYVQAIHQGVEWDLERGRHLFFFLPHPHPIIFAFAVSSLRVLGWWGSIWVVRELVEDGAEHPGRRCGEG